MDRPSLEQIESFGLAIVETSYTKMHHKKKYDKIYEYDTISHKKRYSKQLIYFVCTDYYGYTFLEVANHFKAKVSAIYSSVNIVRKANSKRELADELFDSLNLLYGAKKKLTKDAYISKILPIFANENNSNARSPNDLSKLEIWLINRLYETENK